MLIFDEAWGLEVAEPLRDGNPVTYHGVHVGTFHVTADATGAGAPDWHVQLLPDRDLPPDLAARVGAVAAGRG